MEDIPYASVVDDLNLSTTCSNCFMKGGKLLCCSTCKIVYYCSKVRNIHNNQSMLTLIIRVLFTTIFTV
jgi:hypothetical protein